jgi:hypothetical protein
VNRLQKGKPDGDCEDGCPPVASPPKHQGHPSPTIASVPSLRAARETEHPGRTSDALSLGFTGGNSPYYTYPPRKMKKDRVLATYFYLSTFTDEQEGTPWNKMEMRGRNCLDSLRSKNRTCQR